MYKTGLDLKRTKRDHRDYSHKKTFGIFPLASLPDTYLLKSDVLNQGTTNSCTAFAFCAIQEVQEGVKFDPDWFFNKEKIIDGTDGYYGFPMRVPMKTGVDYGFKPTNKDESDAIQYKEGGYFNIDGSYDVFDNIRVAMYMARNERKSASVGLSWYVDWMDYKIIPEIKPKKELGGHNVKVAGWTKIDNKEYLVIQNSWGVNNGDQGFYYFPRSIVNKYFLWNFMWRSQLEEKDIKTMGIMITLLKQVVDLYKKLLLKLGVGI